MYCLQFIRQTRIIPLNMPRPAKTDRNKKLVEMKESGMSFREVGKELNLHFTTVKEIYDREVDK